MTGTTGAPQPATSTCTETTSPSVTLENDLVALEVDGRSGCITGLSNKATKRDYLSRIRAAEAFRVVMPLRHRVSGWFCDPLGHACDSSSQGDASVEVRRDGGAQVLVASYERLLSVAGDHAIRVEYQASLADGSDEIHMGIALANESGDVVTEVHFPWLVAIERIGKAGDDQVVYPNVITPLRDLFPIPQEGNWEEHPVLLHGTTGRVPYWPGVGGMSMPWVDIGDAREGLYLASLDGTGAYHSLVIRDSGENDVPAVSLAFGFLLKTGPGERWESPNVILSAHVGDWHHAADKYRESIRAWYTPPPASDAARQSLGAFTTTLTSRDFGEIEELAEDIAQHGLDELQVFTFTNYFPMLAADDDLEAEPPRLGLLTGQFGGHERFREAAGNALRRFGVRTGIILSQRLWNVATLTPDLAEKAEAWVMKRASGAPVIETWRHNHFGADPWGSFRGEQLYVMCPAVEEWQDLTIANCRRLLELTGCKLLFFDQAAEYWPCFNEAHQHEDPSASLRASSALLQRLRSEIRDIDPEVVLIGEGAEILTSQHIDLGWHWEFREKNGALQLPSPEVTRYTLPWLRFGLPLADDVPTANRWFALGLYLAVVPRGLESGKRLSDFPQFAAHLSRLAALRERLEHVLVHGTFVDDVGIAVTNAYGNAYATTDELAVLVANLGPAGARAVVRVDRDRWACAERAVIAGLDGSEAHIAFDDGIAMLELEGYDVQALLLPRAQ